ncbi:MAG: exodeoxyribonuclease V subunit beta [Deltaproteobacteria bacterium]|nr:exodeoxyribonuclease V subunit beta [Deltaproteobacteria bacterium]
MTPPTFNLLESPLTGTNLIEASAGTGKTYTIAGLVLRLILEKDLPVERILVVTFTVAATEELRDRVRRRLREALLAFEAGESGDDLLRELVARHEAGPAAAALEAALRGFDEAPLFTIHGFCQRVLAEHAFEGGLLFEAELIADQEALHEEVVDDWWRREIAAGPALLATFALKRGFGSERLRELLRSVTRHPFLEVLPEIAPGDVEEKQAVFNAAFERVCAAWPDARADVSRLLSEYKGLSRSRDNFGREPLAACLGELGQCLAGDAPPACFAALRKVARESFRRKGVLVRGASAPEHPFFDLCQELALAEDALFLTLEAAFLARVRLDLAGKKRAHSVQGFDDLLVNLRAAVVGEGGPALARALRVKYGAALIDEFQDTDPVQYEIFDRVFGVRAEEPSLLFLIGDPKQAIYGFRGADVFAYLEASESAARKYTLGENWRSEPRLLDGVGALFSAVERPFVFPRIGFPTVEAAVRARPRLTIEGEPEGAGHAPLRVWLVRRTEENVDKRTQRITKGWAERALPRAVAAEVSRLLDLGLRGRARLGDRPLEPGDVAVLVRKNREVELVQEALRALAVPSVVYSTASPFASPEAVEVERVLLALAEPGNEALLRAALATDLLGVDGEALHALAGDESGWEIWLSLFRVHHELWARRGFLPAFRHLLAEAEVRERLLSFADGERRLTNVLHLSEVLHGAAAEEKLGMAGLARWLSRRRADRDAGEEYQLRLESDERAVKLVTVHRSKGLEYPVTLCPFSWEGSGLRPDEPGVKVHLFQGVETGGRFVFDLGSPRFEEHRRRAEVESLAENVRLLYVALTRAKNRCVLVWGAFNGSETSAPAYLLHYRGEALGAAGLSPLAEAAKKLTDDDLREGLRPLEGTGAVSVDPLPEAVGVVYRPPRLEGGEPAARVFRGRLAEEWRTTSFTALVSGAPADEELPDRDAVAAAPGGLGGTDAPAAEADEVFAFPAGARAGTCLHEILEHVDFSGAGSPLRAELVAARLAAHGLGPEWRGVAERMVANALTAPLDPERPELTLSRIPRSERLHEVEFTLPLRQEGKPLTPHALSRAFGEAGGDPAALFGTGVTQRLGRLEFSPVRGYLRGFLDLVFRFEGRYYLADWKSNRLGDRVEDYGPEALAAAMTRDHYVLQYHLYAAALHLHLRARLADYDCGRHFGGVYYLFLRGIDPARPGFGVFFDRPAPERIEGLARFLVGVEGRERS